MLKAISDKARIAKEHYEDKMQMMREKGTG